MAQSNANPQSDINPQSDANLQKLASEILKENPQHIIQKMLSRHIATKNLEEQTEKEKKAEDELTRRFLNAREKAMEEQTWEELNLQVLNEITMAMEGQSAVRDLTCHFYSTIREANLAMEIFQKRIAKNKAMTWYTQEYDLLFCWKYGFFLKHNYSSI